MKQKVQKNVWLRISMIVAVMLAFVGTTRANDPITITLEEFTGVNDVHLDGNLHYTSTGTLSNGMIDIAPNGTFTVNVSNGIITSVSLAGSTHTSVKYQTSDGASQTVWNAQPDVPITVTSNGCSSVTYTCVEKKNHLVVSYLSVTYIPSDPVGWTLTATTNNTPDQIMGSVRVDGNVVIATTEKGYGYAEPAYTVTPATAVVEQEGNEFTVTSVPEGTTEVELTVNFAPHADDYTVSFEKDLTNYTDWHFTNIERNNVNQDCDAHHGRRFGKATETTASITTDAPIQYPHTLSCWVAKLNYVQSATWKIEVSEDQTTWTTVATKEFTETNPAQHEWVEFSADLQGYTDVYVRLTYSGNNKKCGVDDIDLQTLTALVDPEIELAESFSGSTTATFTCESDGVTYYYSFDANTPLDEWTACEGDEVEITQTTTIYIYAARGTHRTNVVSASTVCLDEPITVTIGSAEYATFVAPANLSLPDGMIALIVTGASASSVAIEEITDIPANTAVVLNAAPGTYTFTVIASATSDVSGNLLKASDGTKQGAPNIFCLANKEENGVGFYPVASTVTIPAGKAYLEVPVGEDNGNGNVKAFLGFEEDATAIAEVAAKAMNTTAIYNMAGQRLQKMQKGINIVNGKKVLF